MNLLAGAWYSYFRLSIFFFILNSKWRTIPGYGPSKSVWHFHLLPSPPHASSYWQPSIWTALVKPLQVKFWKRVLMSRTKPNHRIANTSALFLRQQYVGSTLGAMNRSGRQPCLKQSSVFPSILPHHPQFLGWVYGLVARSAEGEWLPVWVRQSDCKMCISPQLSKWCPSCQGYTAYWRLWFRRELEVNCIVRHRIKRLWGGRVGSSLATLSFSQSESIPLAGIRANVS